MNSLINSPQISIPTQNTFFSSIPNPFFQPPPTIDMETPIIDIFLLNLKHYFGISNNDILTNPQEFQSIWQNFKEEIKSQMKKMSRIFERLHYEDDELEVISKKIQEKTSFPICIKNMTPSEEYENLMKRGLKTENSWYVEKRMNLLSNLEIQAPKKIKDLINWVNISGDLENIGLVAKKNPLSPTHDNKESIRNSSVRKSFFAYQEPMIKKIKSDSLLSNRTPALPLPLPLPLAQNEIKVANENDAKSNFAVDKVESKEIEWVKFKTILFCKINRVNNGGTFFEYAPTALMNLDHQIIENSIGKNVMKIPGNWKAKSEKGLELEAYLNEVRSKLRFNINKVNGILLSFLGKAKNELSKTFTLEGRKKVQRKWTFHMKNCAKKAIFGNGIIKIEDDNENE